MGRIILDAKDRKILSELDKNCRQPDARIGKKVGLSQQVVSYRINRLVRDGAIRQFHAVIDVAKLGYQIYKAYFKLQSISGKKEDEIRAFLVNHKNVLWVGSCDGSWDLSVTILAKTAVELDAILKEFSGRFSANILYRTIILIIEALHFLKNDKGNMKISSQNENNEKVELDNADNKILSILSTNARISFIDLAQKSGTTLDVTRYRVKKLVDSGIIQGFRIWIDQNVVGKQFYKLLLNLQNTTFEKEKILFGFCKGNKNINYALKTIGLWDMELEYYVDDHEEFRENIMELRNGFQDMIRNYESLLIFDEHKFDYWPFGH